MTRLADADARELACREFVVPVAIEAGAGTGKTRTLVARIGTWLLGPGWDLAARELAEAPSIRPRGAPELDEIAARVCEGVVAITFTDAAAAEMAGRVDRLLGEAAEGTEVTDLETPPPGVDPDTLRARAGALRTVSSRLRLSTIHGFCHRLLAEAPLDAELHPGFQVDPESELAGELATRILVDRLRKTDPLLVDLLAAGVSPPELLSTLTELAVAGVTPRELARDPFGSDALGPLFAALEAALDDLLAVTAPARGGHAVASIHDAFAALDRLRAELASVERDVDGLLALGPALEDAQNEAGKVLGDWASGKFGATETKLLADTARVELAARALARSHRALHELDPELHRLARRALSGPLKELVAHRRHQGVVSYDDLLARAARLLSEKPAVRDRVRRETRQLLVDEFQDTDERQCDLLRRLVLDSTDAARPGLFLVGDPKQSIFGWRSADLEAYAGFLKEIADAGGRFDRLEVNFRSAPPILDEVERMLKPVLREDRGIQASFQKLLPSPDRAGSTGFTSLGRAPVEHWIPTERAALLAGKKTTAERAAEIEAAAIAGDVRELVEAGAARWRDFAILLRSRGDLDDYLEAMRRAGVPYSVQKDRSYFRRREVLDAVAAVRVLIDPTDLIALVAFLRSPFVGVPDAAWLPLWSRGFAAKMVELDGARGLEAARDAVRTAAELFGDPLAPDWQASLLEAVEAIARLRGELRELPATEWIERLRARLLLEPIAASRFLGRFGLANLERLFTDLELRLADEPDPGRALSALRAAIQDETPAQEAKPPEQDDDAVAVMTIHTAKGLQFGHVYVAQAHRRSGAPSPNEVPHLFLGSAADRDPLVLFGAPTPAWRSVQERRRRVEVAEAARLLYVAATRAIDRLVICGKWHEPAARRDPLVAPTFAELLAARRDAVSEPDVENADRVDSDGVRWRAPALEAASSEEPAPPERADSGGASRSEAADRAIEDGSARRAAALERAARPRIARASALGEIEEDFDEEAPSEAADDRRAARARGVALHRALELQRLAAEDETVWRTAARAALLASRPDASAEALADLEIELDSLRSSLLWKQLRLVSGPDSGIVARELPVVAAVGDGIPSPFGPKPTDGYVGTLDLLYRDEKTGELVVADFKSDRLESEADVPALVERYRPQLALYGRAVKDAFGLTAPPRLELWLLALDRIEVVPPTPPIAPIPPIDPVAPR